MKLKLPKIPLLLAVAIAIALGIAGGLVFNTASVRLCITVGKIFGNFLGFIVPLLILGLVAPGIADLGKSAGRLLAITLALAYGFTLFSGFFTFFSCNFAYGSLLASAHGISAVDALGSSLTPFFVIDMPPVFNVMSALLLAFVLGLGAAFSGAPTLKNVLEDFKQIIYKTITGVIIPLLPFYIFCIFTEIAASGQVANVLGVFIKLIFFIFAITIVMLLIQFSIAGGVSGKNPLTLLKNMLPAYATALGTQSSAATIPVTLQQTLKNGVREDIAGFVIPLCAMVHMSGSTMKIVACSMAIMVMTAMPISFAQYALFICLLGITMVAAPGVPGGAIMAAIGVLQAVLGFDEKAVGLMIALYIAMDSFGTACNVTGDGAVAVIINKIYKGR